MATKFDASISRLAASLAEAKAAQRHIVVIDKVSRKSVAGPKTKTVTKPAQEKPAEAPTKMVTATTARDTYKPAEVVVKKAAKKSKLSKLLRGKTFDCSRQ
jgi:hypothetical protein